MKNLYNSILSDIDDIIDTGDKEMDRISQTPRERFIKIISKAGKLSDKNTVIFRNLVEDSTMNKTHNDISCFIPNKLITTLIKLSDNTLNKTDFKNFPNSSKEHNFRCSWDYMHFESLYENEGYKISDIIAQAEFKPGKPVIINTADYKITCIKLNNALIIQCRNLMYIRLDVHRLCVRMLNSFRVGFSIPLDV